MGTDVLEFIYLVCFFLGLGFAVLSALLSGILTGHMDSHIHFDSGGMHADGADLHSHPGEGSVHYSPLSPVIVAMFIATFGGTGVLYKRLVNPSLFVHLPLAAVSGVAVAGSLFWILYHLLATAQSTSHPRAGEAVGIDAEITVAIPNEGLGEIAYTLRGSRFTSPARTVDGKELPAGKAVKIVRQVGQICFVQKA
jgi:membrane protein implicated in regulation of membrane protease activity